MSARLTRTSLRLDDGTNWPDPYLDPDDLEEPQRTFYINAVLSAYAHLAAHPCGTEDTIKVLRDLRRTVEKHRPRGGG